MKQHALERNPSERINWVASIPFILVHVACFAAILTGVSTTAIVLCVVLYFGRMWFITAGYHRYFSHRSYRTSRAFQFVLAVGGTSAAQKGPLWWASHHRDHHRYSDTENDLHSPLKGFWWSHVGWILCDKNKGWDPDGIRDFNKYPELRWLTNHDWLAPWALGIASYFIAGWSGVVVGFLWSTVLLWHGTFTVNSLAHVMGRRRYATTDTSRNSALIAVWTGGEGWHNNHHYYQASARNGFFWWEFDTTYYVLKALSWAHIVSDLKTPPKRILHANRIADGQLDIGMFKAHWEKASATVAASHLAVTTPEPVLASVMAGAGTEDAGAAEADVSTTGLIAGRAALEGHLASTLDEAESYAKLSRRQQRSLPTDDEL